MKAFDEQLLRLKQVLGTTEDQDVAVALGMTKGAFSERKRRGAFPEDKLFALKATMPGLDAFYVITGQRWTPLERAGEDLGFLEAARTNDPAATRSAARVAQNHAKALADAASYPLVRRLLGLLIFCDDATIESLAQMALRLRRPHPLPFDQRSANADADYLPTAVADVLNRKRTEAVKAIATRNTASRGKSGPVTPRSGTSKAADARAKQGMTVRRKPKRT